MEILEGLRIAEVDRLSRSLGNTPLLPGCAVASIMRAGDEIVGFASVQTALHASGSWIHPDYRKKGFTYELRKLLEADLRGKGIQVYFSFPNTDFERALFAKYGPVKEQMAQVKEL